MTAELTAIFRDTSKATRNATPPFKAIIRRGSMVRYFTLRATDDATAAAEAADLLARCHTQPLGAVR